MNKVVIFSDLYLPTFPYLEMPLYDHLSKKMNINVEYVLQDGDFRLTDSNLVKTFGSLNLKTIKSKNDILKILGKNDLFVMRFCYKGFGGDVAQTVRNNKINILQYDPTGIDIRVRNCPAQYLTSKSEKLKKQTIKKFPNYYKEIFVTGTILNDQAVNVSVDRDSFIKSYGLDPAKKFVLLAPANPGELGHQKGIDNEYKQIIKIIKEKCPNYQVAVKAHPLDYTATMKLQPGIIHKNDCWAGKNSWECFAPGITVIRAHEGYEALKACDALVTVRSSVAMEATLFKKPIIFVNRKKYIVNWPFDSKIMMDISINDLSTILNENKYCSAPDEAYENYWKLEMFANDGLAHVRTAETIKKLLDKKI